MLVPNTQNKMPSANSYVATEKSCAYGPKTAHDNSWRVNNLLYTDGLWEGPAWNTKRPRQQQGFKDEQNPHKSFNKNLVHW